MPTSSANKLAAMTWFRYYMKGRCSSTYVFLVNPSMSFYVFRCVLRMTYWHNRSPASCWMMQSCLQWWWNFAGRGGDLATGRALLAVRADLQRPVIGMLRCGNESTNIFSAAASSVFRSFRCSAPVLSQSIISDELNRRRFAHAASISTVCKRFARMLAS